MLRESVFRGLTYLIQLSNIPEEELFKICLEFWHFFSHDCLMKTRGSSMFQQAEVPQIQGMDFASFSGFTTQQSTQMATQLHQQVYPQILDQVKVTMINYMAKPKEVLITIDENGEVEEEHFEDTE